MIPNIAMNAERQAWLAYKAHCLKDLSRKRNYSPRQVFHGNDRSRALFRIWHAARLSLRAVTRPWWKRDNIRFGL